MKFQNTNYDFDSSKRDYRNFCEQGNHDIQVFALPWYLDAVCDSPDDWRVIVYKENQKIIAAFPFLYKKSAGGIWEIRNPWQAKRLGIWFDYREKTSNYKREMLENKVSQYIIENLPYFDVFQIDFDSRYKNWRAFYNNGFTQQSYYSYVVRKQQMIDKDQYLTSITKHKKKDISKLEELLIVESLDSFEEYWSFFIQSYQSRNRTVSYTKEQAQRLVEAALEHNACKIYIAKDTTGKIIGSSFILYDGRRSYCMFGTFDPLSKISPRVLLTYKSMEESTERGLDYDFEGSMIPGVAQYDLEFNPELEPYYCISKYSEKMKCKQGIRQVASYIKSILIGRKILL